MTLAVKVALNPNTTNQPTINSLTSNKILNMSKLKAFADNKLDVALIKISVFYRTENINEPITRTLACDGMLTLYQTTKF